MIDQMRRRHFLQSSALSLGATAVAVGHGPVRAASEEVRVGVIGCGGRSLHKSFAQTPGVKVVAVCDVDSNRLAEAQKATGATMAETDLRRVLDDKTIDAVAIATPDHWHTPAAILAMQAGKHVYIEKPCSHNIREGRLLVEAARKYDKRCQHGTQSRSMDGYEKAWEALRSGAIGEVLAAKVINSQIRANIGHASPAPPPKELDFDLWLGPAPVVDFQPNLVHYGWHWFFPFGTGDIGNDGVHQLDIARWGLGLTGHPSRVTGMGTKVFFDDDQQFPDTYVINYEYPGLGPRGMPIVLTYEQRIWTDYDTEGQENGNIFYGSEGYLSIKRGAILIYGKKNKLVKTEEFGGNDRMHTENFVRAVKEEGKLNAEIEVGHYAASLAHLGNIVARTGQHVVFDSEKEQVISPEAGQSIAQREYRKGHWASL